MKLLSSFLKKIVRHLRTNKTAVSTLLLTLLGLQVGSAGVEVAHHYLSLPQKAASQKTERVLLFGYKQKGDLYISRKDSPFLPEPTPQHKTKDLRIPVVGLTTTSGDSSIDLPF